MPNLRLRRDPVDEDVIPFPTQGTGWQPRPLTTPVARPFGRHEAEAALDRVQEQLTKLSLALDQDGDDDRPSAA